EWSTSILYSLLNKRTNTIITTNLTSEEIRRKYGSRIVSRMLKGCDDRHMMNFEGLDDERRKLWKK
ncbi:DNA replication protein, partial [Streptococcus uberis]|nr:DNA replication protein [Streptococcus uberis]